MIFSIVKFTSLQLRRKKKMLRRYMVEKKIYESLFTSITGKVNGRHQIRINMFLSLRTIIKPRRVSIGMLWSDEVVVRETVHI